jgi:hypothetical protein
MKTTAIAKRLVALCRKAQWETAHKSLYAVNAVSIEPMARPGNPKVTKGRPKIIKKGHAFGAMVEKMHSLKVSAPLVADDIFACTMTMDVTMKGMGRMKMAELCVYHVKAGKIVSEQFFFGGS